MSLAGRPTVKPRAIKPYRGNQHRIVNEVRRRCVCGHARSVALDGDCVTIVCATCGLIGIRIQMRSPTQARSVFEQMKAQFES